MRIVFTDIDGVLNPHWKTKWSKIAIDKYNKVCRDFNLTPVITSTWRLNHTLEELQEIFTKQGITTPIYDFTPHIDQADRGIEIKEWLKNNSVDNFVIIDDKTSDIEPHINNVVKCRSWIGLSPDEYNEIKIILDESNL
jgi:hypothetical protein